MHVKGYGARETKAAIERAHLLIEQAKALGEPPEDALLLFEVLFAFWSTNFLGFNGDLCHELAARFVMLAEKQGSTAPLMSGIASWDIPCCIRGELAEASALRSGNRYLRCRRAPSAGNALWPRHPGVQSFAFDRGPVVTWLS